MKKFSLIMFIVCVCLCISCGQLISTMILSTFGYTSTISVQPTTIYALSLQKNEHQSAVEDFKIQLQSQNGAGFVYEKDNCFYLISSLYENINDAELVKNNLKNNGVDSEILKITLESQTIEGNFSSDEKTVLNNAFKATYETYKKMYDLAISLDTNLIDKSKAKLNASEIYSNLVALKTNFETIFNQKSEQLETLKNHLSYACEVLSNLVSEQYETQNQTFSSLIKLSYCKILLNTY